MAVCEKCDDTGLYEEGHDGGAAQLTCDCPVGVAKQNADKAEHPEHAPLDADKNIGPRRYLEICPQCKRLDYMAVADKVCERCKKLNDATHDLREALNDSLCLLQILVYDDDADGNSICFECECVAGQPHDEDCSTGETLKKIKDVHNKAYSN